MRLREITDKIYAMDNREKMEEANELYYKAAKILMEIKKSSYDELVEEAEKIYYCMDEDEARSIVRSMKPKGERWSMDEIENYLNGKGIYDHVKEYYLAMNMVYNDYCTTAEKYGTDSADFYFDMANNFINDVDAPPHKLYKYFKM